MAVKSYTDLYDYIRNRTQPGEDPTAPLSPHVNSRAIKDAVAMALEQGQGVIDTMRENRYQRQGVVQPREPLGEGGRTQGQQARGSASYKTGQNGRLDPKSLIDVGGGHRLQPNAARAFIQMRETAAREGVNITLTDSYRDYDSQVAVAKKKGLYSKGGLAATPGKSNHGWGIAVDVGDGPQRAWLKKNAQRFGFTTIPREPWHWEYKNG